MQNCSILSLSTSDWAYPYWTSRQFLMFQLARRARVIYASDRPEVRKALQRWLFRLSASKAPFDPPDGVFLLSARWPRTFRFPKLDRWFLQAYASRLQRHLDAGRPSKRVVYVWNPSFLEVVKALSYEVLIYHPYDMFRHFVGSPGKVIQQEEDLCTLANAVVTPHREVARVLAHPNAHVMNNGVFLPAFPHYASLNQPEFLSRFDRPLVGYVGAINDKIDFPLLLEVFEARPEWQLVIVGFAGAGNWKRSEPYERLCSLANVRFMEGVPIDRLAHVIAGFDVGIVPYSLSGWAQFSESPLKLYQYWAMGVPVVSTPLPNMEPISGALAVCRTAEDWQAGIEQQLASRTDASRAQLRARAEAHSWAVNADRVMSLISELE